jgi:hypothetical protein
MSESGVKAITPGKLYEVLTSPDWGLGPHIIDDIGEEHWFSECWNEYFTDIREYRKRKLNKINNVNEEG